MENNNDAQHIVGSAEPLTPEQTRIRLKELEAWGVDLSLSQASLSRTPTERVERMIDLLKIIREMRSSYINRTSQQQNKVTD